MFRTPTSVNLASRGLDTQVEVVSYNRSCETVEQLCYIPGSHQLAVIQVCYSVGVVSVRELAFARRSSLPEQIPLRNLDVLRFLRCTNFVDRYLTGDIDVVAINRNPANWVRPRRYGIRSLHVRTSLIPGPSALRVFTPPPPPPRTTSSTTRSTTRLSTSTTPTHGRGWRSSNTTRCVTWKTVELLRCWIRGLGTE